jgi:phosphomannomutase
MTLEGLKLVVDCDNGAGYKVVPRTLAEQVAWTCRPTTVATKSGPP